MLDLMIQQNYNHCVATSFVNGMICLEGNGIAEFAKRIGTNSNEGIKSLMEQFVEEMYRVIDKGLTQELTFSTDESSDLRRALRIIREKETIPGFTDEYKFEWVSRFNLNELNELLENNKGFILGFKPRTHHVICFYKKQDGLFYYKDSLKCEPGSINENEFKDYLEYSMVIQKV